MKLRSVLFVLLFCCSVQLAERTCAQEKLWRDPESALRDDPDFGMQGEYASDSTGVQVVALGDGRFDVYFLKGGLPGAGWEPGMERTKFTGKREGKEGLCFDAANKAVGKWNREQLTMNLANGVNHSLKRVERRSPSLDSTPPADGVMLFDGTSTDEWFQGRIESGLLQATGTTTKKRFGDYKLHLEFRTPYKPFARGQKRGNSGVYHSGRWETQILDSFGLDPKDNECGGIYSIARPRLNMCLPPLTWQTYDVEFTAAKFDAAGTRSAWPRITVRLNGVVIHDNVELNKDFTTSAPLSSPIDGPLGPIFLQEHSNPVEFRNIWIVPIGPNRQSEKQSLLKGRRFLTLNTVVRVHQIEVTREEAHGPDESSIHTVAEARTFRDAIETAWPGGKITWALSWLALHDDRAQYRELREQIVAYHSRYGDEITFIPGAYFSNMYNSREQVNRDLRDGLRRVSEIVGNNYRPRSVVAGFLSSYNLRYLSEVEGIHVCQGNIWSQYAVDNGDGEGSICYPYYPSREHFCKPAQGEEDFVDCVNLDGWTVDFLAARIPGRKKVNGELWRSRQGVGPIETLLDI